MADRNIFNFTVRFSRKSYDIDSIIKLTRDKDKANSADQKGALADRTKYPFQYLLIWSKQATKNKETKYCIFGTTKYPFSKTKITNLMNLPNDVASFEKIAGKNKYEEREEIMNKTDGEIKEYGRFPTGGKKQTKNKPKQTPKKRVRSNEHEVHHPLFNEPDAFNQVQNIDDDTFDQANEEDEKDNEENDEVPADDNEDNDFADQPPLKKRKVVHLAQDLDYNTLMNFTEEEFAAWCVAQGQDITELWQCAIDLKNENKKLYDIYGTLSDQLDAVKKLCHTVINCFEELKKNCNEENNNPAKHDEDDI